MCARYDAVGLRLADTRRGNGRAAIPDLTAQPVG
jgi:hypothetical protein